ncbi:MAG: MFS transporter, partial [Variovorax sp.]|nr:MFS transporter [Variovorax sp.]
ERAGEEVAEFGIVAGRLADERQPAAALGEEAVRRLAPERRRDGAYAWGLHEHTADPERIVEWFMVESWAEHLRQHHRVSHADADLQDEVVRWHIGPQRPEVHHFLAL